MLVGIKDSSRQFEEIKEILKSKPISQFGAQEFNDHIDGLISSSKGILKGGITLNRTENILEKLNVILFIEELMVNVNKEPCKMGSVQRLAKETANEIIQSLCTINRESERWIEPGLFNAGQTYRSAHQMLLMINSLLPFYIRSLYENKDVQNFRELFSKFPISINENVLEKSKEEAKNRPHEKASFTEKEMVNTLSSMRLFSGPSKFATLRPNIDTQYIDSDTGLELDFPLANKIDIEFDGPHHFVGQTQTNTIEHIRKEKQLQENGWIRIGLSQNTIDQYTQVLGKSKHINFVSRHLGNILSLYVVAQFIQKHDLLNVSKIAVREKIKELHYEISRDNPSAFIGNGAITIKFRSSQKKEKKQKGVEKGSNVDKQKKQLKELFAIEKQIVDFLDHNYLNNMINSEDFIREFLDFDWRYNELDRQRLNLELKLGKLDLRIATKCKDISPMRNELKKINKKCPIYQTRINEVDDLQKEINRLKREFSSLEMQYQNAAKEQEAGLEKINNTVAKHLHIDGLDKLISEVDAQYKSVTEPALVMKQEQEEEYQAPSILVGGPR